MIKLRKERGMSLLEMSAAAIFVAIALLGTTAAIVSGANLSTEVTRLRAAARAASAIVEDARATDFADLVDTYDGKTFAVGSSESGIDEGSAYVTVTQIDNGSTTYLLYEIEVVITFEGTAGDQTYPIVTYISDRVAGSSLGGSSEIPSDESQTTTQTETQTTDPIVVTDPLVVTDPVLE